MNGARYGWKGEKDRGTWRVVVVKNSCVLAMTNGADSYRGLYRLLVNNRPQKAAIPRSKTNRSRVFPFAISAP